MKNKKKYILFIFIFLILISYVTEIKGIDIIDDFEKNGDSQEVVVFILDTEVNMDFVQKRFLNLDGEVSHGSIVTRIINQEAPSVKIISIPVNNEDGSINKDKYFNGLNKIKNYIRINSNKRVLINISLGFRSKSSEHRDLTKKINNLGGQIIAAAGNNNSSNKMYPAGFEGVLAVANASQREKAPSSNYGQYIDISAQGSTDHIARVYLPWGTKIRRIQAEGTSFSAPRVTGLLARIIHMQPNISFKKALNIIKNNADPIDDNYYKEDMLGAGLLNKINSLQEIDPFYKIKFYSRYFMGFLVLFISSLVLWSKLGITSIFFIILFVLVVFPLAVTIGLNLFNLLDQLEFMHMVYYIYIIFTFLFLTYISSWNKKFLLFVYGLCIIFTNILGHFINLSFNNRIYIFIFILFSLVIYEKWNLYLLNNYNIKNKYLFNKLNSKSDNISQKAEIRIKKKTNTKNELLNKLFKTDNEKLKFKIIKILLTSHSPSINLYLDILLDNPRYFKLLINEINKEQIHNKIITLLFDILKTSNINQKRKAAILLKKYNSKIIIPRIKEKIEKNNIDLQLTLEILETCGKKGKDLIPYVKDIILNKNEMWVRYQALKTLKAIHPNPQQLIPFLKKLTRDKQQLVQLEAKGLLEEIK